MVKFRILRSEASGKSFGLLTMEPSFDLVLSLSLSSFIGVQNPDCMTPIGQPTKTVDQRPCIITIGEWKKKPQGPHLIGQLIVTMALRCTSRRRRKRSTLFFLSLVNQSIIFYNRIMDCCTLFSEKLSSLNRSNSDSTMTFQTIHFLAPKIKI